MLHLQNKHKLGFAELSKSTAAHPSKIKTRETMQCVEGPPTSKHKKIDGFQQTKKQKDCTEKLAWNICLDLQPISFVEDKGFKDFVNCLQSSFNIPDRWVIRNKIISDLYMTEKFNLQQKLNEIDTFAITLDHWTSTAQDEYMAITAHFLSEDFTVNDYCLNVRHMP